MEVSYCLKSDLKKWLIPKNKKLNYSKKRKISMSDISRKFRPWTHKQNLKKYSANTVNWIHHLRQVTLFVVKRLSFFFFWLSIWMAISFHPSLQMFRGSIYFTHTCLHNLQLWRLTFSCEVSCKITKASVSTCARSSKYKQKNSVWRKVNGAEEICVHLFLAQVNCIPFHSLLFSYRSEILSTFLVLGVLYK